MTQQEKISPAVELFRELRGQVDQLREREAAVVKAGHLDIGRDLWLSSDPAGQAEISCTPAGKGFTLRLQEGDSGGWAALGMRLPVTELKQADYLGLLVALHTGDLVSFTPTLRYLLPDGMVDVPTPVPVIMAGGPREQLSHIPLDPERLERATGCELNLFFHTDSFVAEFAKIEPLLIL